MVDLNYFYFDRDCGLDILLTVKTTCCHVDFITEAHITFIRTGLLTMDLDHFVLALFLNDH